MLAIWNILFQLCFQPSRYLNHRIKSNDTFLRNKAFASTTLQPHNDRMPCFCETSEH